MLAWVTHILLVGIQNGTVILENSFSFSGKSNRATTIQLTIALSDIYPTDLKTHPQKNLYPNLHSNFVCNNEKL